MKRFAPSIIAAAVFFFTACGTTPALNERNLRVRYVNMSIVFQYMVNNDPEAVSLDRGLERQRTRVETLEKELMNAADAGMRGFLAKDLENARAELERLRRGEELYKQKTYEEIRRALSVIAARSNIDYILNADDGLVYAGKNMDITETLLREIAARRKRSAPASR